MNLVPEMVICTTCKGTGFVLKGRFRVKATCETCKGKKKIPARRDEQRDTSPRQVEENDSSSDIALVVGAIMTSHGEARAESQQSETPPVFVGGGGGSSGAGAGGNIPDAPPEAPSIAVETPAETPSVEIDTSSVGGSDSGGSGD